MQSRIVEFNVPSRVLVFGVRLADMAGKLGTKHNGMGDNWNWGAFYCLLNYANDITAEPWYSPLGKIVE